MTKKQFPEGFFTKDRPIAKPKYVNAEEMLNNYEADCEVYENNGDSLDAELWMVYYLKNHSSADVQPVVHCGKCKWCGHSTDGTQDYCFNDLWNWDGTPKVSKNDFCSHGERLHGDEHDNG